MNKPLTIVLFSLIFSGITAGRVFAAAVPTVACTNTGAYGQTTACPAQHKVLVDIQVRNPQTTQYDQNLGSDTPYGAADSVCAKVVLTNTDTNPVSSLTLQVIYPSAYTFQSGPGTFDAASDTANLPIQSMQPGESRTFYYCGVVSNANTLQNKPSLDCGNIFTAKAVLNGKVNQDSTQFCVNYQTAGKGGYYVYPTPGANKTPGTGPELLGLAALLPSGLAGLFLRRKSAKNA